MTTWSLWLVSRSIWFDEHPTEIFCLWESWGLDLGNIRNLTRKWTISFAFFLAPLPWVTTMVCPSPISPLLINCWTLAITCMLTSLLSSRRRLLTSTRRTQRGQT
uniref:Uncharacterized protein n=1 Tax=Cacopsylla melanoneura TaxID=428564 RepID=A0A8D8ZJ69_9HEMI